MINQSKKRNTQNLFYTLKINQRNALIMALTETYNTILYYIIHVYEGG